MKIPKLIEISYFAPSKIDAFGSSHLVQDGNQIPFKQIGHFALDDNMSTNFQARELKTVYVECTCQYLKFTFQKNHLNNNNIFN